LDGGGLSALAWYVITGSFGGVGESIAAGLLYLLPILALQAVLERPMAAGWLRPASDVLGDFRRVQTHDRPGAAAVGNLLMLLTRLAKTWSGLYTQTGL